MSSELKIEAYWNGAKFVCQDTPLRQRLESLPIGIPLILTIKEHKPHRTHSQNAYFHAVVSWWNRRQYALYGNLLTDEQAKNMLKLIVGFVEAKEIRGPKGVKRVKVPRETSKLNRAEFCELMDRINHRCLEDFGEMPPDRSMIDA